MLEQYNELPEGFLEISAEKLHDILSKPSLIHLKGREPQPVFICTLLHGNETTGFYALQRLLKHYLPGELPRSISIFIGNVKAAEAGVRRLEEQVDYNRVWPGTHQHYLAEAHMMQQVTEIMRQMNPLASIDIHNNTGKNPHYACINKLHPDYLSLASRFSNTVVYFITPRGVQSAAFAEFCPSVTLECGQSGQAEGEDHALAFLQQVLEMKRFARDDLPQPILYHTVARVKIPEEFSYGFEDDATINLLPEIENYNFLELPAGTVLASVEPQSSAYLQAFDEDEREVGREFFEYHDDRIVIKKPVMPAMLTMNTKIIRQDCLCYLMERLVVD